jgi:hypothetical protein
MGWHIIGIGKEKTLNYGLAHIEKALERPILFSVNGDPSSRDKENDDDAACERILRSGHMDIDLPSL